MILHLDCFSGVSGDKFLAALLDAGVPERVPLEALSALGLDDVFLGVEKVSRRGITATAISVRWKPSHPDRTWKGIRSLLGSSSLPERVKHDAARVFSLLAEAEATVHGTAIDSVHFHEVGAVDSIVDIVGSVACLAELGPAKISCSAVALGSGTVETEHGTLPVPAPATALLLEGIPCYAGTEASEMTTPTGAALVRALATSFGPMPPMIPVRVAYGAGSRDPATPNVLRLILGEPVATDAFSTDEAVSVLEANVDDATPEQLAYATEQLLSEGALDVWQTPIVMKKGRSAVTVSAMVPPADAARLSLRLAELTGSLGVRRTRTDRLVVSRKTLTLTTSLGEVRMKVSGEGHALRYRPEYEDCARIARATGMPLDSVMRVAAHEAAEAEEVPGAEPVAGARPVAGAETESQPEDQPQSGAGS